MGLPDKGTLARGKIHRSYVGVRRATTHIWCNWIGYRDHERCWHQLQDRRAT